MSITFSTSNSIRCTCMRDWNDAFDIASSQGEEGPPPFECVHCIDNDVNMANVNAIEWMHWVGMKDIDYGGQILAKELAVLCRRRLWPEERNHDAEVESTVTSTPGHATLIDFGRPADYLFTQTQRILRLCEKAGDQFVNWG